MTDDAGGTTETEEVSIDEAMGSALFRNAESPESVSGQQLQSVFDSGVSFHAAPPPMQYEQLPRSAASGTAAVQRLRLPAGEVLERPLRPSVVVERISERDDQLRHPVQVSTGKLEPITNLTFIRFFNIDKYYCLELVFSQ